MWGSIQEVLCRTIGNIIHDIWGPVGFRMGYEEDTKEIILIIWDRSCRCDDKEEVVNEKFKFDLEVMTELKAKQEIITEIEKYLIENYS